MMNKDRTPHIITIVSLAVFIVLSFACGTTENATNTGGSSGGTASSPYFTGDGGKGRSIAILAPQASGLAENQNYLPAFGTGGTGQQFFDLLRNKRIGPGESG